MKNPASSPNIAPLPLAGVWAAIRPHLGIIGLIILGAGVAVFWAGATGQPGEDQFMDLISGIVGVGGGLGILGLRAGWFDFQVKKGPMKLEAYWACALGLAVAMGFFIWHYGMHQIGGWDDSTTIEFGWRVYNGQILNKDFPNAFPVNYVLGVKFAFQWLGVYWSSTIVMTVIFAVITFFWSLYLLTELFGRYLVVLLWAVAIQAPTDLLKSFWWYNSITIIASLLYVFSAILWLRRPASWPALVSYGLSLALLAGMKPNSGGLLIPVITVVLFLSEPHRFKTVAVSIGAFLVFYMFLAMNNVNLVDMIKGYLSAAHRAVDLTHFLFFRSWGERDSIYAAALISLLPMIAIFYQYRRRVFCRQAVIPVITLVTGWYGFISNSDQFIDLTFVLFGEVLLVAELHHLAAPSAGPALTLPAGWNRHLAWLSMVFIASGVAQGVTREYVKTSGIPFFFEYDGDKYVITNGFFKGLHCGRVFEELLNEEQNVLEQAQGSTVWFGPSIQWSYAAFNKPSPTNQAPWWEPGQSFPIPERGAYFDRFINSRFQVLIFCKNLLTGYNEDELQRMAEQYDVDQTNQVLTVLRLKK